MRNFNFLLFFLIFTCTSLNAQTIMNIHQSNGSVLQIPINTIDSITYTNSNPGTLATISTSAINSITNSSAVSGGNITNNGGSLVTQYGICWNTSPNPTTANNFTNDGSGIGGFTSSLSGLAANVTYYVRAYAINSLGTAYGNQLSFTTAAGVIGSFPSGTVFCNNQATAVVDVINPGTGKTWMDRNLGASQVALSYTDTFSYGDLYQWGRRADGHQCRNSDTTSILSTTDQPLHGFYIISPNSPGDWRVSSNPNLWQGVNGINNPCPYGYRLPTEAECIAEIGTWTFSDSRGAFASPLRLPVAGRRYQSNGSVANMNTITGYYWTSSFNTSSGRMLNFASSASVGTGSRAAGFSVRCIKN